jgi:hypothetical protein
MDSAFVPGKGAAGTGGGAGDTAPVPGLFKNFSMKGLFAGGGGGGATVAVGAGAGPAAIPEDREVNGSFHTTATAAAANAGGLSTAAAAVTNPLTKAAAPNTTAMAARSPPSSQRKPAPAVPLAPTGPSTTTGYDWSYSKEQFDLIRARVRFFFEVLGMI